MPFAEVAKNLQTGAMHSIQLKASTRQGSNYSTHHWFCMVLLLVLQALLEQHFHHQTSQAKMYAVLQNLL